MSVSLVTVIDVGSDAVKVVAVRRKKNRCVLVGAGMMPIGADVREAPEPAKALGALIRRLMQKHSIPQGHVVTTLSGRGTMMRYLTVPMVPPWKLALLMGFEVEEQLGASASATEVAYDYRILSLPSSPDGQFPMFLALAQVPVVEERMAVVAPAVKRVDDVGLQSLGAHNLFCWSPQCRQETVSLLMDIGVEETHITVAEDNRLLFARTISFGGRQFTQAVQRNLELLPLEAEDYKREQARILPDDNDPLEDETLCRVSRALRAEARNLSGQMQSSLRFFSNQFGTELTPTVVCITGGGSRIEGLPEALAASTGYEVERLDPAQAIEGHGGAMTELLESDLAHHYAPALGTALSRLRQGFSVSLVPPAVQKKRDFWKRQVYTYYSAALALVLLVLLLMGGCPFYGGGWRESSYLQARNQAWEKHLKEAEAKHQALNKVKDLNDVLAMQVQALSMRKNSGADLLRALSVLKTKTPLNVFFTELSTSEIQDEVKPEEGAPAVPARGKGKPTGTFQTNRFIELKGYLVGRSSIEEARQFLIKFKESLLKNQFRLFKAIHIRRTRELEKEDPELKDIYTLRLWSEAEEKPTRTVRHRSEGVSMSFVLQCVLTEEN